MNINHKELFCTCILMFICSDFKSREYNFSKRKDVIKCKLSRPRIYIQILKYIISQNSIQVPSWAILKEFRRKLQFLTLSFSGLIYVFLKNIPIFYQFLWSKYSEVGAGPDCWLLKNSNSVCRILVSFYSKFYGFIIAFFETCNCNKW